MNNQKIAIVTGSRRGIGLAIAKALLNEGYRVIVSDVAPCSEVAHLSDELDEANYEYIRCDISNSADRDELFDYIKNVYGRLDLLVNNAGVAPRERVDLLEVSEDAFSWLLDINLKGTFFMCRGAAKLMIDTKTPRARIVNIASISSYTASINRGEYCISKAGVSMVTSLFADRLAEFNLPVFEVRPGVILSDMTAGVKEKYQKLIDGGLTPTKRFGTPEDVADAVAALCGGAFDFSTGQVVNVDGGFHIRRL